MTQWQFMVYLGTTSCGRKQWSPTSWCGVSPRTRSIGTGDGRWFRPWTRIARWMEGIPEWEMSTRLEEIKMMSSSPSSWLKHWSISTCFSVMMISSIWSSGSLTQRLIHCQSEESIPSTDPIQNCEDQNYLQKYHKTTQFKFMQSKVVQKLSNLRIPLQCVFSSVWSCHTFVVLSSLKSSLQYQYLFPNDPQPQHKKVKSNWYDRRNFFTVEVLLKCMPYVKEIRD